MPSTYTARNRLTKQGQGEGVNIWGLVLNAVLDLIDFALDGITAITASGATTLTTANGAADQARARILNVTAAAAAIITIPSVEKFYLVRAATADVTITNGSNSATVKAGDIGYVLTDGSAIWLGLVTDFGGRRLKGVGSPLTATDGVNRAYVDGLAFSPALPGQDGNDGKWVRTIAGVASWEAIDLAYIVAALGFTPANGADIPVKSTGAELQALSDDEKFVTAKAVKDAMALAALNLATPDLSKPVQTHTMAANGTLGAPTNVTPGTTGAIFIKQPASGGPYTLAYNSAYLPFGTAPVLSTTANAVDLLTWIAETAGKVRYTLQKGGAA